MRGQVRRGTSHAGTLPGLLAISFLAVAGCLGSDAGPDDGATPASGVDTGPSFPVRVVDADGAPVNGAQVCIGDSRQDAVTLTPACQGTGRDGTTSMAWPCDGPCPYTKYVGATFAEKDGTYSNSVETHGTSSMPENEIVLFIIR